MLSTTINVVRTGRIISAVVVIFINMRSNDFNHTNHDLS